MSGPVLLYDGYCPLCNNSVQFILRHESDNQIRFAPLDSAAGYQIMQTCRRSDSGQESLLFFDGNKCLSESDAVFAICKHLKRPWRWFRLFRWVPAGIRNACYRFVANRRYRWFGRYPECMLPDPKDPSRVFVQED